MHKAEQRVGLPREAVKNDMAVAALLPPLSTPCSAVPGCLQVVYNLLLSGKGNLDWTWRRCGWTPGRPSLCNSHLTSLCTLQQITAGNPGTTPHLGCSGRWRCCPAWTMHSNGTTAKSHLCFLNYKSLREKETCSWTDCGLQLSLFPGQPLPYQTGFNLSHLDTNSRGAELSKRKKPQKTGPRDLRSVLCIVS